MINKIRYRVVFNRSRQLNKRGEGLVQIECQQGTDKIYFSTNVYLQPQYFKNGCVVGLENADALNFTIFTQRQDIERVELEYIKKGVDVHLYLLREAVRSHISPSAKLADFGMEVVNNSDRTELTKKNYQTLMNNLDKFQKNVHITDIDYNFICKYDKWLQNSGISHNTRISRLRLLRALMNEAKNRDIIEKNPFDKYRIQQMVSKKGYVTREQLRALERKKLAGKVEIARDAFLVGCYTGLRYSDVITLRQEHIKDGWLTKKMKKTGFVVDIPIETIFDGKMVGVINKYGGDIGKLTKAVPSNSALNKLLRDVFDELEIDKKITFHSSRHTCATLLSQQGVNITIIQKILGHQKLQTTQIYSEVDRITISNGLKRKK